MAEKEKNHHVIRISRAVSEKLAAAHAAEIGKRGRAFSLGKYTDEIILKGLEVKND